MANLNLENSRLLDVVDENDNVIDSKPREEIHKLGLLHRDVHIWMFDKNNNIFFQKRGISVLWAGLLDATVGGHLDSGEKYLEAAVRETKEETNISILPTDLIFLKKFTSIMDPSKTGFPTIQNNFIRYLYVYKKPIEEEELKEEEGILGVGFQKLSIDFLQNIDQEKEKLFAECVVKDELPEVIKYLQNPNTGK